MNERPADRQSSAEHTTPMPPSAAAAPQTADAAQQTDVDRGPLARPARVEQGEVGETGFLPDDRMDSLRDRWDDVQAGFVDDPQSAVQKGHQLVAELVDELTQTFTRERTNLESQWKGGGAADTEQLRIALQRYRSFFNRLLGT